MADINSITLVGRATKDVELHTTKNGTSIATLSLANNSSNDKVSYFDVVLYDKTAENAAKYVQKGKQIAITGKLQQRSWEKDGKKQYVVEIAGYQLQFLGNRDDKPMTQAQALNSGKDFVVEDLDDSKPIDLSEIPF